MQVYFDKVGITPTTASLVLAKADADGSGHYKLHLPERPSEGIYRLRVGEQKVNLILDGKESKIQLSGDLGSLNQFNYQLRGSSGSEAYQSLMKRLLARQIQATDVKNFVDTTANPLAGVLVAVQTIGGNTSLMDIYNRARERLAQAYPGSNHVNEFSGFLTAIQQAALNAGSTNGYVFIEEADRKPAPDIKLPSPSGKEFSLSSLKGKVVLLDFWASWCRPCRMENPNVVKIYNRYKDKGFTVFSVSLDGVDSRTEAMLQNDPAKIKQLRAEEIRKWKEAIEKDGLVWEYHVSDLKKWECAPAQVYGVSSIPRTFMIDKEGRVAAMNIRGAELIEQTLQKLL